MNRQTHNLQQGSQAWHDFRAKHFGASELSAAAGASKYTTRADLVKEKATGITKEIDDRTQTLFNKGHAAEESARVIAEEIICDELSPMVMSLEIDGVPLSASLDGITFDGSVIWEHKLYSEKLAEQVRNKELDPHYCLQIDQQLLVSGASKCLFMTSDGTKENMAWMWYDAAQSDFESICNTWKQFAADVAAYVPADIKEMPKAEVTIELPALFVHAKGEITEHNMDAFGLALATKLAETRAIALVTDLDFSNAKAAASKFRETAKAIKLSKEAMLAQTDTIGEAARKMDAWAEDLNKTALQLEKDVEREDKAKKEVIVLGGKNAYAEHIAALEEEIKPIRLNLEAPVFAEAIKNKRSYTSMQDAVDTMLAGAKIAADTAAKDVRAKLTWFKDSSAGFSFLFSDLSILIANNGMEAFQAIVTGRINQHKADEAAKEEATRLRMEAEAKEKAEREAAAKLAEETARIRKEEQEKARAEAVALANREQLAAATRKADAIYADQHSADKMLPAEVLQPKNTPQSEAVMHDGARPAAVSQMEPAAHFVGMDMAKPGTDQTVYHNANTANIDRTPSAAPSREALAKAVAFEFGVEIDVAMDWLQEAFAEVAA